MKMAEIDSTSRVRVPISGWPWQLGLAIWRRPREVLGKILQEPRGAWKLPLLLLTLTAILHVLVAAPLLKAQMQSQPAPLPQGFEYYPPAMQEQYMRAVEVTSGPAFIYVFPLALGLARTWLGWLFVGGALYLMMTLLGVKASSGAVLALSAWSGLPYLLRDLIQSGYMLAAHQLVQSPGLSGFISQDGSAFNQLIGQGMQFLDIYLVWQFAFLLIGLPIIAPSSSSKRWVSALVVLILVLLLQAMPGFLGQRLSSMTIIRPYF
jgi:hypothetical protein